MAKVMVSPPDAFLKKVDQVAGAQNRSRSELIREALHALFGSEQRGVRSWKKSLAPLRALEQQWIGQWYSTDIIRYYRETHYGRKNRR
jgi:predicted transcriptional regulator